MIIIEIKLFIQYLLPDLQCSLTLYNCHLAGELTLHYDVTTEQQNIALYFTITSEICSTIQYNAFFILLTEKAFKNVNPVFTSLQLQLLATLLYSGDNFRGQNNTWEIQNWKSFILKMH